ncbi:MAG: superoxide dismutase family protein [Proteobacteria bacterium]|nr:superoxide dismutase family protein [Pseudomonadota bacterium]
MSRHRKILLALACAAPLSFGAAHAWAAGAEAVTGDLKGADGKAAGSVKVTEAPNGVLIHIEAQGLPAGWHGAHLHEKGDCSDAKFANAGGHVHRGDKVVHGLLNPDANDAGDLPNVFVTSDGSLNVELYSTLSSLKGGHHRAKLADADGFAIVIHASPDDYTSQPIGGAGARIACAAFK